MKQFDEIGKNMPFRQTDEQVDAMLNAIEARTISQAPLRRRSAMVRRFVVAASAAAAVAVMATVLLHTLNSQPSAYDAVINSQSLSEVLTQMPDEAVEGEIYYTQNAMAYYY
ncbi:MAG: hypothetical protein ACI30L_03375 [Muribaculaceae bacterium]